MPLYDFSCPECLLKTERLVRYEDRDGQLCGHCAAPLRRLAPLIHISGGDLSRKTLWDAKQDRALSESQGAYFKAEHKKNEDQYFASIGLGG